MLKLLITFLKELVVGQGSFSAKCTGLTDEYKINKILKECLYDKEHKHK